MKKTFLLFGVAAIMAASCTTVTKTASTTNVPSSLLSSTVADLEVMPQRISYTMSPTKAVRRGGLANVKQAAENEALAKLGGNADLLVEPEYVVENTNYVFFKKVKSITVSGRPAKFTNFHSLNDSVWVNPVFRGLYKDNTKKGTGGLLKGLLGK